MKWYWFRAAVLFLQVASQLIPKQVQEDFEHLTANWYNTSKINDVSPLGVFGPSAFAVVETNPEGVALAGVRIGKGKAIVCGHQVWADMSNLTQYGDRQLATNMMTWLKSTGGRILGIGQSDQNASLAFWKTLGFSGADFVDDKRLHPHTPWDVIPDFSLDNYDVLILRRVEDIFGNGIAGDGYILNQTRVEMTRDWIAAGGSALLTGRIWEWISKKKYNQHNGLYHPINTICRQDGVTVCGDTIHQSGRNGTIGKAQNVLESNLLYTLKYLGNLSAEEAMTSDNKNRQARVFHTTDYYLTSVPRAEFLKQTELVRAIIVTITAPVCDETQIKNLNYNPTMTNPVQSKDYPSRCCMVLLGQARDLTGAAWKDTNETLNYFPGNVPSTDFTSLTVKLTAMRPAWLFTGGYAKAGEMITISLVDSDDSFTEPLTIQIGHHNYEPSQFENYERYHRLCTSRSLDPSVSNSITFTHWFGGMIYIVIDSVWHGRDFSLKLDNVLLAPVYRLGETTDKQWAINRILPAPYAEIEVAESVFVVKSSLVRNISANGILTMATFWDNASCSVIELLRHLPNDPNRELTRFIFDVQTHSNGREQIRWAQGIKTSNYGQSGWANNTIYPTQMFTAGCSVCDPDYAGDDAALFATNCADEYCEGQWHTFFKMGVREMETWWYKAVFHPFGWGMQWVVPNIVPVYVAEQLGLKKRDLSEFEQAAIAFWKDPTQKYYWQGDCPKCITYGLLFIELANAFGWECFQQVFEAYYALPQKLHVGNSDEKAINYWYWLMSVATNRDLIPFFNNRWKYGVSNNDHGTNVVEPMNLTKWDLKDAVISKCKPIQPRKCRISDIH